MKKAAGRRQNLCTHIQAGMKRNLLTAVTLTGLCVALAVVTITLSGCNTLAALNIVNPTYSIRDIRPRVDIAIPLSASSIDFDFTLGVDNPNAVGLRLDEIDFNLLINGNHILNTVSQQGISIPAKGRGDVRLSARVGYQNLRTLFREIADVVQGNRARYEIRGDAYYNTPVGRLKFPVTVYSSR
jgi:LEA14-like dessication related protein